MVIAEAFPVKNVASVVGITAGAGAVGGAVFNIFIGSLLVTMGNVLFAVMGVMHLVTAVILWRMVRHETRKTVKINLKHCKYGKSENNDYGTPAEIPVRARVDVLVVGGGPAGTWPHGAAAGREPTRHS